jgi:hypothetical protein
VAPRLARRLNPKEAAVARLQILELPEGTGDDRPPFALIIDQCEGVPLELVESVESHWRQVGAQIGARGTLVFAETVEISANDTPPLAGDNQPSATPDDRIMQAHERSRLALCDALLLSRNTTWHKLIEQVAERQKIVARVLNLPEQSQAVSADRDMADYLQGYGVGVRAAKRAARTDRPQTVDEGESIGRPTHADGTPYRYHEIKAGGWGHCDGCRTWGQWTAEEPHECPGTFNRGPVAPTPGS